jgi:protocatechuate 3,4-dioxygenase beta subunit
MKLFSFFRFFRRQSPKAQRSAKPLRAHLRLEALEDRTLPSGNTISGYVFLDTNNNGLFDPGESPLANSTIQLRNASGVTIGTAVTDANGYYSFAIDDTINTSPTTLTRTASVAATPTDWTQIQSIGQFDPSLGTLTPIEIDNGGSFVSDIKVESLDAAPSTITATDSGTLTLTGAGLTGLVASSSTSKTFNATAFDGTIDFAGTSGTDFGNQTTNASTSLTLTDAASLAAYTGTGSVSLTEAAHATSGASGAGNLIAQISTNATAQISVIYHYIPSNALKPGNYTIVQTSQPPGYLEGLESASGVVLKGTVGTDSIPVTLANTNLTNNDFAELAPASLSGYVYIDANNDGIKQAGEAGLAGVTISLTGTNDLEAVSQSAVTAADGSYQFGNLRPGTYALTETQPASYLQGKATLGSAGGTVNNDPSFSMITLGTGVVGVNYNFGELLPANLSGFVYLDANNNGVKDSGEKGISGVTVTLSGTNDQGTAVSATQTSAADGSYSFSNLRPGTYTLTEIAPAGYLDGKDSVGSAGGTLGTDKLSAITLASGTAGTNYDFAEVLPPNISGFVYLDLNDNGVMDSGEKGLAGVTITLTGTNDLGAGISQTQLTASDGSYQFLNLRPGTYKVTETPPAGYLDGKDTAGSAGGTAGPEEISGIALGVNITAVNYNFAELTPGALSGFVYLDQDNNGVKETSESGIARVTVSLTGTDDRSAAVSVTQKTGSDGSYSFTNLRPGSYQITETQPSAYLAGKETVGSAGGQAGNDQFSGISLGVGIAGINYNFGELLPPNPTHQISGASGSDVVFIKPDLLVLSKAQFLSNGGTGSVTPMILAEASFVDGVYQALLNRHADPTGLVDWVGALQAGMSRGQLVQAIAASGEHLGLEVDQLYATFLHRSADAAGRAFWINLLASGVSEQSAARAFIASGEYQTAHADNSTYVAGLYADVLGRNASAGEIAGWAQALQSGASRDAVAAAFLTSGEEYLGLLDADYQHFLHRSVDPAGQQAWLGQLLGGQATPETVANAILASDEFFAQAQAASMS